MAKKTPKPTKTPTTPTTTAPKAEETCTDLILCYPLKSKTPIADFLTRGKHHPLSIGALRMFFPNMSKGELLAEIDRERRQGIPIRSSREREDAYYIAVSEEDFWDYIDERVEEITEELSQLEKAIDRRDELIVEEISDQKLEEYYAKEEELLKIDEDD